MPRLYVPSESANVSRRLPVGAGLTVSGMTLGAGWPVDVCGKAIPRCAYDGKA